MKKSKFMLGVLVVLSLLLVSIGDISFFTSSAEGPVKVYGDILELDPVETSALWAEYGEVKTIGAKYGDSYFERASSPTAIFARYYGVPLNISGYKENGYFHLWVYVENSTGIDGQIELSSITADDHELSWNINELALEDGWNELYLPLSTGNIVGGEMDYTSVKFFRMYVNNAVTAGIDGLYFCHEVEAEEGFLCGDKTIIDNADSTDGWFGSDLEVKTDNPPEGTGYIANNGVDGAGNSVLVSIFDPIDLSKYGEDGYFHLYVYISDYSALAYGNIEISGSGTPDAALYWQIREYARHSGWNELYLPLGEGNPQNGEINLSAVNYFRIFGGGNGFKQLGVDDLFACKEKVEVTLTKSGENFVVGIKGWNDTHKYQIWTYQKTQSEIFGGEGLTNQWVLSHPYTLGSDRTPNGFTVDGDAITRNIGSFNSVDRNYTVAVKVIDGAGNFVGQYKDTFTQAEAGEVVINKVTVDGQFADDKAFVKDIANDSPVAFVVTGNGVAGTEYTAKVDQTGDQLVASGAGLNEFSWNISGMQPGNYSVTLTASTADSSDSRTVNIKLYKNDPAVVYGEMTELVVTGAAENDNFKIDINPTVTGGKFRYRISEPWRGTIPGGDSELVEIPAAPLSNTAIPRTAYGVYEVQTFTYRNGVSSADDGAVRTVTNARPGEPVTLNVTVDGNPAGAEMITKAKGTAIVFTPAATGLPLPQYSFWRRDANGWVLIRDYSGEGLTWTPNRVGLYTIQVRAKATGGLTYEVLKNIEFNINEVGGDKIADVANITINQAALDTDAKTRTPILITANATSAEQDLLYKFIISNGYIYYVETAYSADPTYMWVPGKSGNYTISVLVKNQASFGKYDAVETFTVTVQ